MQITSCKIKAPVAKTKAPLTKNRVLYYIVTIDLRFTGIMGTVDHFCGYNNVTNHPTVITIVGMLTSQSWVVYDIVIPTLRPTTQEFRGINDVKKMLQPKD